MGRAVRKSLMGWALVAAFSPLAAFAQDGLAGVPVTDQNASAPAEATPAEPLRLEVSVSQRTLTVKVGESAVKTYQVAVGKDQHPTPRGRFSIRRIIWNPRWVPPNAAWARGKTPKGPGDPNNPMGRVKLFFSEPDYYIHGTENQASLGRAESHGCVRMSNEDVVELAKLVMEHGGQPRPESWFQRILSRVRSSDEVRLATPVQVVVTG